jgi:hypothetical protein
VASLTTFNLSHYGNYSSSGSQAGGNGGSQNGGAGVTITYGLGAGFPTTSGAGGGGNSSPGAGGKSGASCSIIYLLILLYLVNSSIIVLDTSIFLTVQ